MNVDARTSRLPTRTKLARTHCSLGNFYRKERKYEEAKKHFDKVDKIFEEMGFDGKNTGSTLCSIDENSVRFRYAPPADAHILADAHQFKASIRQDKGEFLEAMKEYKEAYFYSSISRGADHSLSGNVYRHFAEVFLECGEYEWAQLYLAAFIRVMEKKDGGARHGTVGIIHDYIGKAKQKTSFLEEALEHYKNSLDIKFEKFGEEHPVVAITRNNEGIVYLKQGRFDDAMEKFMDAFNIVKKCFVGDDMKDVHEWDIDLSVVPNTERKPGKEDCVYEECFGEDRHAAAYVYNNIGNELQEREMYNDALRFYEKSIEIKSSTIGEHHRSVAITCGNVATMFRRMSANEFNESDRKYEQQGQRLLQEWEAKNQLAISYKIKESRNDADDDGEVGVPEGDAGDYNNDDDDNAKVDAPSSDDGYFILGDFLLRVSTDQGHEDKDIVNKLRKWQEDWSEMEQSKNKKQRTSSGIGFACPLHKLHGRIQPKSVALEK